MKLDLKKSELVNLSQDNKVLPEALTPQVAGGTRPMPSSPFNGCITANMDTCVSNPDGSTIGCCIIP
ncbi:hypothetical protein ABC502_11780 [Alkalimonas sp. NCh-2]|uniref:hypothetical protein n=1 Tax=Alkalimonas sp. NCh-2 TaxID=3144846 RepID=UPI0031F6F4A7